MSQTERLHWIDAQIRDGRYPNAASVAAHFEVSTRVAFADRNYLLQRLNAPLVTDRARGGWAYSDDTYMLPFLALTEAQAANLRHSLLAAQEYLGAQDAAVISLVFERLNPEFPAWIDPESIGGAIRLVQGAEIARDLLAACRTAVRNRRRMFLRYHSLERNSIDDRIVQPYHLHNFQGEHHMIAWCEWRQEFRQFLLVRALKWELLEGEGAFARDKPLDVEKYLKQGLGVRHSEPVITVRARFTPYQARWIRERRYHPSQEIESLPDGGLILTLHVAGASEVKRWLLGYGAEVEILEPESLRAEMAAEAKKVQKLYGETPE